MQHRILFVAGWLFSFTFLFAQQGVENLSRLKIEQIMQGDHFVGFLPENVFWSEDSRTIYFSWNPEMDTLRSLYKTTLAGEKPVAVGIEEQRFLPQGGAYNSARDKKVFSKFGDIFLLDIPGGKLTQITRTAENESGPEFSGDGSKILYTREDNLFAWDIEEGTTTQLTRLRRGNERKEPPLSAFEKWLQEDQLAYFEVLQKRKGARELRESRNEELRPSSPKEYFFGEKQVSNLVASPDLKFISFRLTKRSGAKNTQVPDFVTESGFTEDLNARVKVGFPQDTYEMIIFDVEKDSFYSVDTRQIEGIFDKPEFLREYHRDTTPYQAEYEKPREVIIHGPVYSEDEKAAVVVRSLDNKDRWIMLLDLPTGRLRLLDRQRDEAWIGGPGVEGWNFTAGNIGWLPGNEKLWFQSEETGYSHLYTVEVSSGAKQALTSGSFEIRDAFLSRDETHFFVEANAESPHQLHFYRLPLTGGKLEKITTLAGNHDVALSPDEKYLAIRYSYSNKPWELYLMENRPGAEMRQVTRSTTPAFESYRWRDPQIIYFTARDGAKVPARLYRPESPKRKGPAVIFVHGAGYLQNVHQWWSSYYREFMFHNLLVDNGYTVLDIDFRASDGYGRDWRTAIYRHMGGKDLTDQVDGAKFLVEKMGVDPERIGIYGGSYGGFITLMAMFTTPGVFKSGAALRSVTDWAHYNHPYTANILNTPTEDSIAYRRSSPIYHAEGLKDHLLILHGMVDTNVHFQDVVRLAQRLIELGKENWEFAVFPVEDHGFVEPSSWSDEYKRIFRLFQQTLKE